MNVRTLLAAAAIALTLPVGALAHHGWSGQEDKITVMEGAIAAVSYRNPHGTIDIIAADKTRWTITLAPLPRMGARGLTADKLKVGDRVRVQGNRNLDKSRLELKASQITIGGVTTNLMA
jgi:hypothetical protein